MSEKPISYSIVVPVYNEEESLKPLFAELIAVMTPINKPYEIVFVNDCSSDRSLPIIEEFRNAFPEVVRIVNLQKRSGQTYGLRKGLDATKGEIAVTLDADLQNDPADIPKMLEKMKEGFDCVCGWRKARQDTQLKAVLSKSGNVLQRLFTGMKIHDVSCTLRIYKRVCINKIALNWEGQHRFIPLSLSLQGFKVGEIVSNHRLRKFGKTKYSHKRIFRVIGDFFRVLRARGRQ
jgi:glycosyltransferase involved in cell wall biosynthesis